VEFFWIAKRRSGNLLVEANSHTVENKIIRKNIELSLLENAGKGLTCFNTFLIYKNLWEQ
jgi:hypothetical protein